MQGTYSKLLSLQGNPVTMHDIEQRGQILRAVEAGAATEALSLALDVLGLGQAKALLQPVSAGEVWRMAYRIYDKYNKQLQAAEGDERIRVYQALGVDENHLYMTGGRLGQCLALAIHDTLAGG